MSVLPSANEPRRAQDRGWRTRAACRPVEVDPETFFPTAERGPVYDAQVAAAKAICAGCRVRAECLAEALVRIPDGIAGGLTPAERRSRRPQPTGAEVVLTLGLCPGAGRAQVRAAGLVLLMAGRPVPEVAARCRVNERTVAGWQTRHRPTRAGPGGGGKPRRPPGSPPDLPDAQPTGRDTNAGRTRS